MRPSGTSFLNPAAASTPVICVASLIIGVSTPPGHTTLTRIPACPSSIAAQRLKPISPCLEAAYAPRPGEPASPLTEEILTIEPHPRCSILGITVRSEEHTSELQSLMRNSYAV